MKANHGEHKGHRERTEERQMCETSMHGRGHARGSEHDAARDRRPTRCVSPSLNAPYAYAGIHATRFQNNPKQFSPLKGYYEEAIVNLQILIPNFNPHGQACSTCPGN